jgi:hypothetical protein
LPASAVRAFEKIENRNWENGVPLTDLLDRTNRLAGQFLPEEDGRDSRVSREFAPRSFRRYQTLGCIDAPERVGKRAMYGYRHLVQALLVRRLLWERLSAEHIAALLTGRSMEETKRMLFEGIETVARQSGGVVDEGPGEVEAWRRVRVTPGVELHLWEGLPKLKPAEAKKLLVLLETSLRKTLR